MSKIHFSTIGLAGVYCKAFPDARDCAYLSANGLGTKYRQVVQSTAKNVNAALGRMQRIVGKEFGV